LQYFFLPSRKRERKRSHGRSAPDGLWFLLIAVSGFVSILDFPSVIQTINPYYGIKYLSENGIAGFFLLSQVILCATGGEALYADMGQLGKLPIIRAWYFVFFALILTT